MGAVGRDEVDQRLRILDVLDEVGPARVRGQGAVARRLIELCPRRVQRRNTGVAAAGQVDRSKVQREAKQVVA
ncbi:hypothetical protein D3C86_679620 [compost metagenome]